MDRVRRAAHVRHLSCRTEKAYAGWIRPFIAFHEFRHPIELGVSGVSRFLSWLATERNVSASTQNQALGVLLFLYREVLEGDFGELQGLIRARRPSRLPVVLGREEVDSLLGELSGTTHLVVSLLYGAGLRTLECLRLRIKDVDLGRRQIWVRDGKGRRDRATLRPWAGRWPCRHRRAMRDRHDRDVRSGAG